MDEIQCIGHKENAIRQSIQYFHCSRADLQVMAFDCSLLNLNAPYHLFMHPVLIANASTFCVTQALTTKPTFWWDSIVFGCHFSASLRVDIMVELVPSIVFIVMISSGLQCIKRLWNIYSRHLLRVLLSSRPWQALQVLIQISNLPKA